MKRKVDIIILLDKSSVDYSSDPRVFRTAYFFANKGFKVSIIGFQNAKSHIVLNENLEIHNIIDDSIISFKSIFGLRNKVAQQILEGFEFDNVIANDHLMLSIGALLKKSKPSIKLVYDSHEFFQDYHIEFFNNEPLSIRIKTKIWRWLEQRIERKEVQLADVVIGPNKSIATLFNKVFKLKNEALFIRNIPNYDKTINEKHLIAHNQDIFDLLESNKKFNHVIYFGNYMRKLNGMEYLLEAVQQFPDELRLIILGTDKSGGYFQSMISDLNIEDKITIIERLPHQLMPVVAQYAKLSVVPTLHNDYLQCYLSLPNKFLESIKMNLPLVSIDLPEQKNIIDQYKNGICISENGNIASSIYEACNEILNNYDEFKKNANLCNNQIDINDDLEKLAATIS